MRRKFPDFWLLHERQHEMRTELISIATDTLPLDGAFYRLMPSPPVR
jgi:hypothetical protein